MNEVTVPKLGIESISREKLELIERILKGNPDWYSWTTILWEHPIVSASLQVMRSGVARLTNEALNPIIGEKDWIAVPVGSIVWGISANERTDDFSDVDVVLITSNPNIPSLLTGQKPLPDHLDVVQTVVIQDDELADIQNPYNYSGHEGITHFYNLRYDIGDFGARSVISSLLTPDNMIAGDSKYLPALRRAFFENKFVSSAEGALQTLFAIRHYIGKYYLSWSDISLIENPSNGRLEYEPKRQQRFKELVSVCAGFSSLTEKELFDWMELVYGYTGLLAKNIPEVPDIHNFFQAIDYKLETRS